MKRFRSPIVFLGVVAVVAAILQELGKPPEARTWHGTLLGWIPYDFRPPTPRRFMAALWNPEDPHLFTAEAFGVGWSVNLYQAKQRLTGSLNP